LEEEESAAYAASLGVLELPSTSPGYLLDQTGGEGNPQYLPQSKQGRYHPSERQPIILCNLLPL